MTNVHNCIEVGRVSLLYLDLILNDKNVNIKLIASINIVEDTLIRSVHFLAYFEKYERS